MSKFVDATHCNIISLTFEKSNLSTVLNKSIVFSFDNLDSQLTEKIPTFPANSIEINFSFYRCLSDEMNTRNSTIISFI